MSTLTFDPSISFKHNLGQSFCSTNYLGQSGHSKSLLLNSHIYKTVIIYQRDT